MEVWNVKFLYTFETDSNRYSSQSLISIYNAGISKGTFEFLLKNKFTFRVKNDLQRSWLVPVAEVLNPLVGFHIMYAEILEYIYYFPKELNYSIKDV